MKLIPGVMNVLLTKCPVGYAHGVSKPKRATKQKSLVKVIRVRKQETLIF